MPGNTQKILTEIWHHFWLKMMMKSGLEKIILKFHSGLQRYLLTCQANSALLGRFLCTGQQQLWRPSWNLKIIFSRPLFAIIFKPKMVSNHRKNFLCIVWHQKPTVVWYEVQKTYLCNYYMWSYTSYAGGWQSQCKYLNISVCDISGKKLSIEEWYSGILPSEMLIHSTMCLF